MHIAFLTPEFPHDKTSPSGGLGTSIKNLTTALTERAVKVTVFVYGQKTQEIIRENNFEIHLVKNKKYLFLGWFFHRKHIEKYCNAIIQEKSINLIEAPDWTGITAFMSFKVPLVIRFHGSDTYFCHLENRKQKLKNFWFEKLAIKDAKAFIAPTKFAGEVSKKLFKIGEKEIRTIHYGLNLNNFENENPKEFDKHLILYIGTLIRKKGILELPEIFDKVRNDFPDVKLVLIGGDSFDIKTNSQSTWELMKNLFSEKALKHVSYLGKIPYEEIQNYIKKANVCVFPTFAETLGMVTIESMAMKKAVVNSNIGWSQELIIDGENGYLVHPTNHDEFANRIVGILADNNLALEIGSKGRLQVEEKFDINKNVKENVDFYLKIINSKPV
ncbi:glycosyltransferase family 4 protein [Flavobacterium olei]|uniref:glycosyltransferase family 4 protein n=1 Tax=Flavobacterium olei TaxID=1886782 RepID=UPI003219AF9E